MQSCSLSADDACGSLPSTEKYLAKSTWPGARRSENCMHRRGGGHLGFDLVVGDAEAVLGAQLVVGLRAPCALSASARLAFSASMAGRQ